MTHETTAPAGGRMFRITAFLAGATAFLAAHGLEVVGWSIVFEPGGGHAAWFLNSGRAVAFAAACLFLAALVYVRTQELARSSWAIDALNLAAGATLAMTAVLVFIGPGTIFPLALAIGALVAVIACTAGAAAATKL